MSPYGNGGGKHARGPPLRVPRCPRGRGGGRLSSGAERRRACFGHQDCTAWFWDEPASAPDGPPTPKSPMSEAQADAAVAIYIAALDRICRAMPEEQAA